MLLFVGLRLCTYRFNFMGHIHVVLNAHMWAYVHAYKSAQNAQGPMPASGLLPEPGHQRGYWCRKKLKSVDSSWLDFARAPWLAFFRARASPHRPIAAIQTTKQSSHGFCGPQEMMGNSVPRGQKVFDHFQAVIWLQTAGWGRHFILPIVVAVSNVGFEPGISRNHFWLGKSNVLIMRTNDVRHVRHLAKTH